MLTAGIVLFVIGALVAWFASGDVERLGFAVAVIGVAVIIIALIIDLTGEGDLERDLIAPLITWRLLKARL